METTVENSKSSVTGAQVITATETSEAVTVHGHTLQPGDSPVTIGGIIVPLASSSLIVGSSRIQLSGLSTPVGIAFGSQIITANSASNYIADGHTFTPGGPLITVDGTRISLAPTLSYVIIGSSTEALATTQGLGGLILSGFGIFGVPTASATDIGCTGQTFKGVVGSIYSVFSLPLMTVVVGTEVLVLCLDVV